MWQSIIQQISDIIGQDFIPQEREKLQGGDINQSYRISDGTLTFFVKTNDKSLLPMLIAESDNLEALAKTQALTLPNPLALGTTKSHSYLILEYFPLTDLTESSYYQLGCDLAQLHQWGDQKEYGFDFDNYIGFTSQPNGWHKKWPRFFAEQRIGWQLQLLREKGLILVEDNSDFIELICRRLSGHNPKPALLHGDLWKGNVARIGNSVIAYDPASYWGDRECDIALTELWGEFDDAFYQGYQEHYPLDEGYNDRKEIYNLYHLLNHCNSFAGEYIEMTQKKITQILAQ